MKKILLFAIILFPVFSYAQRIQLAAMGGFSMSNIINDDFGNYKNAFSPNGRIKATINTKILSFGASIDLFNISSTTTGGHLDINSGSVSNEKINYTPLCSAITISAFIEKQISIGKSFIFFGVNGGYIISNSFEYDNETINRENKGISVGIQLGASIPIYKKLSFISELSPRYISTSGSRGTDALVFPLNVGLSYSF